MDFSPWGMIGAVATVIAVLVMVVTAVTNRTRKSLSCIVSRVPVLTMGDRADASNVKVLYGETEVQSLHRVRIRFRSSGNKAITPADFVRPIVVTVQAPAKILTATVIESNPVDVSEGIDYAGTAKITVVPLLMNPKDEFSIEALIGDLATKPIIRGRIMDGKLVYREQPEEDSTARAAAVSSRAAIVAAAVGSIAFGASIAPRTAESLLSVLSSWITIEALLGVTSAVAALAATVTGFGLATGWRRNHPSDNGD